MKIQMTLILALAVSSVFAEQDTVAVVKDTISFEKIVQWDANPVESQGHTGTCWSFSGLSFFDICGSI